MTPNPNLPDDVREDDPRAPWNQLDSNALTTCYGTNAVSTLLRGQTNARTLFSLLELTQDWEVYLPGLRRQAQCRDADQARHKTGIRTLSSMRKAQSKANVCKMQKDQTPLALVHAKRISRTPEPPEGRMECFSQEGSAHCLRRKVRVLRRSQSWFLDPRPCGRKRQSASKVGRRDDWGVRLGQAQRLPEVTSRYVPQLQHRTRMEQRCVSA